jgi:D-glycero-alpha-D-manno-heptose 1-phosphate guanylyltransferase
MKTKEAILLAGGVTEPAVHCRNGSFKSMILIGKKPLLEYIFEYLHKYGMEHIVLAIGNEWKTVFNQFGNQYLSMKISYSIEKEPLGTGGAVKLAAKKLIGNHFFILKADRYFRVNLNDLNEFYFAHEADISITIKRKKDISNYITVETDVCKVTGFREKQSDTTGLINGGTYITSRAFLDKFNLPSKFSFEKDLLMEHLPFIKICAMKSDASHFDMDMKSDLEKLEEEIIHTL